jgi:hypothetical protein
MAPIRTEAAAGRALVERGLALAAKLPAQAARLAEELAAGTTLLRPDYMPLAIPLDGRSLPELTLTAPGWTKLNFESLKLMRFDADLGLVDRAGAYEVVGDDTGTEPDLVGKPVLTRWLRHPSWSIRTDAPLPLSHLVLANRADAKGARSHQLTMKLPQGAPPIGTSTAKQKPLFRMDDTGALACHALALADELALLATGLLPMVAAEPEASHDGIALSLATDGFDLDAQNDSEATLAAIAAAAATLLCGELRRRLPADDWTFAAPERCTCLRLSRDVVAGGIVAESPIVVHLGLNGDGGRRETTLTFGGAQPVCDGLLLRPVPAEAPLWQHDWLVSGAAGETFSHVRIGRVERGTWPIPGARLRIRDASRKLAAPELNPVAAALDMLRLCGRLSTGVRRGDAPVTAAYGFVWSLFLGNAFSRLRSFWQAKIVPGLEFRDISAAVADFNANLPVRHHRILSKHGFKTPLYARDIGAILRQIARLEEIVAIETGQTLFLSYGTLLGCIRDHAFIPHDDDIDVAWVFDARDFDDMLAKRTALLTRLSTYPDVAIEDPHPAKARVNCSIKIAKAGPGIRLDLFPLWRTPDGQVHGMMERLKVRALKGDWFGAFRRAEFYGGSVWVPEQAEAFLEDRYGPGWVTPDPSYGLG